MNRFRSALSVTALAVGLAGCSAAGTATGTSIAGTTSTSSTSNSSTTSGTAQAAVSLDALAADTHYDADDLTWDAAAEVAVTLADGASSVTSAVSAAVTVDGDTVTLSAAGVTTVEESEEGLEAQHIVMSGGTANVTANDDGVNASGGASRSTSGGGMGGGEMAVGDYSVEITGGSLTINAQGDGLDSNGNASISGGTVVVNGPTNSGNGALDVNGELTVTGGTVAAAGSVGMVVTPGTSSSTQSGVQVTLGSAVPAGTVVQIADSAGNVVSAFVTTKATASLVFSSSAITEGEEYTVYTGGTATVSAGVGDGSLDGARQVGTVTAGEYTAAQGPGGGGFGARP
ncbi:carbohydrate-binding domain-containing protein [Pseudarthrobacter cellobiosi]|uniref:carbohydrate-binding domain-containing protein n=1 Tax=Pseudarthrobacter cellobiosi TaxID=2953654 RepID=UPI00208E3ED8|nr:carbohydrate-binding domain-containing protein [Pseudarthrobacter sp. HLT1-5]MCO4255376.1 carbohydrate-binding domain-containing protein [Pseudarthrobacter sp. HLT1-5]